VTVFPIRPAEEGDVAALDAGLAALSQEIGDPHRATRRELRDGLFGPSACAHALVAEGDGGLAGLALFTPVFSTVRGGPGVFVSDVWVARGARGRGLGARLLAAVSEAAGDGWNARFLRLAVHDDNSAARDVYDRLGFAPVSGETVMVAEGDAFKRLGRRR